MGAEEHNHDPVGIAVDFVDSNPGTIAKNPMTNPDQVGRKNRSGSNRETQWSGIRAEEL